MLKIEINADLLAFVAGFESHEPTRYFLESVFFDKIENAIAATDGHKLGQVKNAYTILDGELKEGFSVKIDKNILRFLKGLKRLPIILEIEGKNCTIKSNQGAFSSELFEKTYPDYRKVIPSDPAKAGGVINFNPSLLEAFYGYRKDDRLTFKITDETTPILIYNNNLPDFTGVLMPCRI